MKFKLGDKVKLKSEQKGPNKDYVMVILGTSNRKGYHYRAGRTFFGMRFHLKEQDLILVK